MDRWAYAIRTGTEDVHQCHTAILAIEQAVLRLIQEDAVDGSSDGRYFTNCDFFNDI